MIGGFKLSHWIGFAGFCLLLASLGLWSYAGEDYAKACAGIGLFFTFAATMLAEDHCGGLPHASERPEKQGVDE
jgi:hypothetical protein